MGSPRNEPTSETTDADTLPVSKVAAEIARPISENAWDSEAPTVVHTRRPLFARPPRLPSP